MTKIAYSERLALEGQQELTHDDAAPNSALKQTINHTLTNLHDCNTC